MIFWPCMENITTMVKSRAISVIGEILRNEPPVVPVLTPGLDQHEAVSMAGQERNAQVDEDAPGDLAYGDSGCVRTLKAHQRWQEP